MNTKPNVLSVAIFGLILLLAVPSIAVDICSTAEQLKSLSGYDLGVKIEKTVENCAGTVSDDHPLTQGVLADIKSTENTDAVAILRIQGSIVKKLLKHAKNIPVTDKNSVLSGQIVFLVEELIVWDRTPYLYTSAAERWKWSNHESLYEEINYDMIIEKDRLTNETLQGIIELIRVVNLCNAMVLKEADKAIAKQAEVLKSARKQFDIYAKYARMRYPWELAINDWIYKKQGARDDVFNLPPGWQLGFLHPYAGYDFSDLSSSGPNGIFMIDILGFQKLSYGGKKATKWPVGLSVFVSYTRENSCDEIGRGIMLHVREWSVGAHVRNTAEKNNDVIAVVGLDFGKVIGFGGGM